MTKLIKSIISQEIIETKILVIRGKKVMLDRDLARLYGVPTGRLNEQVKRNFKRFPDDFIFQLSKEEMTNWISQFAISNSIKMGLRKRPYAFTENGVAMLSSVLNSERAIEVNIRIMRVFTKIREIMIRHQDLQKKIERMEQKYDKQIMSIFEVLKQLLIKPTEIQLKHQIGFKIDKK